MIEKPFKSIEEAKEHVTKNTYNNPLFRTWKAINDVFTAKPGAYSIINATLLQELSSLYVTVNDEKISIISLHDNFDETKALDYIDELEDKLIYKSTCEKFVSALLMHFIIKGDTDMPSNILYKFVRKSVHSKEHEGRELFNINVAPSHFVLSQFDMIYFYKVITVLKMLRDHPELSINKRDLRGFIFSIMNMRDGFLTDDFIIEANKILSHFPKETKQCEKQNSRSNSYNLSHTYEELLDRLESSDYNIEDFISSISSYFWSEDKLKLLKLAYTNDPERVLSIFIAYFAAPISSTKTIKYRASLYKDLVDSCDYIDFGDLVLPHTSETFQAYALLEEI